MTNDGRIRMGKLARIDHQLAELKAKEAALLIERAKLFDGIAESGADLETGRKQHTRHRPKLQPVSEMDRHRARRVLQEAAVNTKVAGR